MPLLIVEVALISLYFISNEITNRENIQAIRTVAEQDVAKTGMREAAGINRQLEGIARATEFLRQHTAIVMAGDKPCALDNPARFAYSEDGAFYTTKDTGGAAVFYSGYVPIEIVSQAGMGTKMTVWLIQSFPHSELVSA
jgi:hypothetical protein